MLTATDSVLAEAESSPPPSQQFNLLGHYAAMLELDREVHEDHALADAEVALARQVVGFNPGSVLLACCGVGRHILPLICGGVRRIVGVDLSEETVAVACERYGCHNGVELVVADLCRWTTDKRFDAVLLLGNSFGDIIDREQLTEMVRRMVASLRTGGVFVMDYIGQGYLARCVEGRTSQWSTNFGGQPAIDERTPRFDRASGIMTIDIVVRRAKDQPPIWSGSYQKLVLTPDEVRAIFAAASVGLESIGRATAQSRYHAEHENTLGMLAASTWWRGTKRRG